MCSQFPMGASKEMKTCVSVDVPSSWDNSKVWVFQNLVSSPPHTPILPSKHLQHHLLTWISCSCILMLLIEGCLEQGHNFIAPFVIFVSKSLMYMNGCVEVALPLPWSSCIVLSLRSEVCLASYGALIQLCLYFQDCKRRLQKLLEQPCSLSPKFCSE